MKNIRIIISFISIALIFFACDDKLERSAEGPFSEKTPMLNIGNSSVQLVAVDDGAADPFLIRINWSKPRFTYESGLPVEVTDVEYTVELDLADNLFAKLIVVTKTENLYADLYSQQLSNWVAGLLGIEELEESQLVDIRVKVEYKEKGVAQTPLYSNVANLEILPIVLEPEPDPVTIRWQQIEGDWDAFAVYAWGAKEVFGSWPGLLVEPDEDGWYTVEFPGYVPLNLILNNNDGGAKFDFLVSDEENPLESGNYYVNTTDGTFEKAAVTIQWKQVEGDWDAFAVYAWGDAEIFGGWPGLVVEPVDGWYSVSVPSAGTFNLILNNNNGGKQFDFVSSSEDNPMENSLYAVNTDDNSFVKIEEITLRWKQVEGDWDAFAVYVWGISEIYGGWPGQVVEPEDGWYSLTVPPVRPINLILNNNGGGQQFDFLSDPYESACYEVTGSSFAKTAEITIRWKYVGSEWTEFAIYAWGGFPAFETFGGWPGTTVTPDAEGWCSVTVPAGQTVGNAIFNNNGGGGQFNVEMEITSDICFEITSDSYTVVDCP